MLMRSKYIVLYGIHMLMFELIFVIFLAVDKDGLPFILIITSYIKSVFKKTDIFQQF